MWSNKYIGIPYVDRGRDVNGVDCWGLVRLVYDHEFDIKLPSFAESYDGQDELRIQDLISQYKEGWQRLDEPAEGSLVLFRINGLESHVGVMVNTTQFLHARIGQSSALENLNSSSWTKRILGYFRYTENSGAVLNVVPHPLRTERFTLPVPAGTTVEELSKWIVEQYSVPQELKTKVTIIVNGKPIPASDWAITTLDDKDAVEYRAVSTGGNTFRLFAMLAIAIAAPYIVASIGGFSSVAAAQAAMGTVGFTAATMGVSLVGSLLLNAIAPIRPPPEPKDPGSTERQLMVTGGANKASPYEAIPVVLGRAKITPPLGANNFLSYQNERESYLSMLLVWGYGPLNIESSTLKIGDVSLSDYTLATFSDGSDKLITFDYKTDPTEQQQSLFDAIYGNDITQVNKNLTLACDGNPEDSNVAPGPWAEAASTEITNKITVALHFPEGLRRIVLKGDGAGESTSTQVRVAYEIKLGTNGSWEPLKIAYYGSDAPKKDAFTITETFDVDNELAQIRVRRETGDNVEDNSQYRYCHSITLLQVTFTRNAKPVRDPKNCKIAKTAIEIQASEQLSGQIEGINAIVQTWCLRWTGTAWEYGTTSNPADLYRYVLQHPANPQRILDTEISTKLNLSEIQRWHAYCVEKGFTYNSVLGTQRSVLDTLRDICAAGRASPALLDGKWTVVIDEPKPLIVQHFTPHNSWGFESSKGLPKLPDALKVVYYDEDQDYQEAEIIVYAAGKNIDNSELFETIVLPGVTKASLVIDHARWHMAQALLRKEIYVINTDIEYIVCNRGDRVKVTHDVPMWGLGSGRIKNRISDTVMELDETVPIDDIGQYTIRIRGKSGTSTERSIRKTFNISTIEKVGNTVTVTLSVVDHPISVGDSVIVNSNISAINNTVVVTAITTTGFKYVLQGQSIGSTAATGTVTLSDGYYKKIQLSAATLASVVDAGDLFLYGEYQQEAQDLIITNIEPTNNKSARITLVDYGVTDSYNIFDDYLTLTEDVVFETQITYPPELLINGFKATDIPTITSIVSDDVALETISPGTYSYHIRVSYANATGLNTNVQYVECQYDYASSTNSSNYKIIRVGYLANTINIPNVIGGETYKIRLRYVGKDGRAGSWSNWSTHIVAGKTINYMVLDSLVVSRTRRFLNISPGATVIPSDFSHFEVRVFKDAGTGDFWSNDSDSILKVKTTSTAIVDLKLFALPRLSAGGVKYRVAARPVDKIGNYGSSSILSAFTLYAIAP